MTDPLASGASPIARWRRWQAGLATVILLVWTGTPAATASEASKGADAGTPTPLAVVSTCTGEDWALPVRLLPQHDAGFFTMDVRSKRPEIAHDGRTFTWAELQPSEDQFDFSPIHEALRESAARGRGLVLRIKASVAKRASVYGPLTAVPDWVRKKHSPPTGRIRDRGPSDYIEVVPPWHPGVQAEYLRFVEAFGREGLHRYPSLLGIYVHGISTSFGEEMWMDRTGYRAMLDIGMTPEALEAAMTARIRAWAAALDDRPELLAWVGAGWIDAGKDASSYRKLRDRLDALALQLGMGRRWGNIESYNSAFEKNGQVLAANGRLQTDLAHPLIAERRIWAAENENYLHSSKQAPFVYRMAVLRALQMRIRLLWVSDFAVTLDPALSSYYAVMAGRMGKDSPDAWVLLREVDLRRGKREFPMGNFERGLAQLETDASSRTVRALAVERPPQSRDAMESIDWTARRTDREHGADRMRFALADEFVEKGQPLPRTLQLTWHDNGAAWHLELRTAEGMLKSQVVGGAGGNIDRTTTLVLQEDRRRSPDSTGIDMSIIADRGDLIARRLRVLRAIHEPSQPDCRERG